MSAQIKYRISPNFTHEKLENPSYRDLVDVFEDRMLNWLIEPAHQLLSIRHGTIAAVALLTSYFETIEIYHSGQDSKGKSKAFFRKGFRHVFAPAEKPGIPFVAITDALYTAVRCGFAHEASAHKTVFFNADGKNAFYVSWPRKNGLFDEQGTLESVVINPLRFYECIHIQFCDYVRQLRLEQDTNLKANFLAAVELKWGLNEPEPFFGMTEERFLHRE